MLANNDPFPSRLLFRRDWVVLIALLVVLVGAPTMVSADHKDDESPRDPIRIGIIGDQTLSFDLQASYDVLSEGVDALSAEDLDVVLHVGDLIESGVSPDQIRADFAQATGILDRLPVDWFLVAGDHDVNPPLFQQDSSDRSREALFQELLGARIPDFADRPFYSFDVGDFHFIGLYSHQALHADPRFGNIFLGTIEDDQFEWLARDLIENIDARAVIVFIHQPLWYHWSGWKRVHELLRLFRVAAVVSGHFHYDQNNGRLDGIQYLTVGATGGFTKNGSRDAGDIDHVTVLEVAGVRRVKAELISLSDEQELRFTPRLDMDRVQALDVQLGNFFNFASANPVFVKDGQLVDACDSGQPARITINQIGNPIDVPLTVDIGFTSDPGGVVLDGPAFTPGLCTEEVGGTTCVLPRTARTFISNYSSVTIDTFFGPPLWETGLAVSGGPPQPGTALLFDIRTSFDGRSGELFLETTVSTTVQACP